MSRSTVTVPEIVDRGKRVLRTLLQVGIPSFLTLAAGFPAVAAQVGVYLSPRLQVALIGLAGAITSAAVFLTWLMSIPVVNDVLARVGLAGHSTIAAPLDTETRAWSLQALNDAAH